MQIHIAWRRHPRVHRHSLGLLRTTWIAVLAAAVLQFGNDMTLNSLLLVRSHAHALIARIWSNSEPLEQPYPCKSLDQSQAFLSGALATCYLAGHPRGQKLPFVSGAGVVSSVVIWTTCSVLFSVLAKKLTGLILWLVGAGGGNESSHIYDVMMTKLGYSRLVGKAKCARELTSNHLLQKMHFAHAVPPFEPLTSVPYSRVSTPVT